LRLADDDGVEARSGSANASSSRQDSGRPNHDVARDCPTSKNSATIEPCAPTSPAARSTCQDRDSVGDCGSSVETRPANANRRPDALIPSSDARTRAVAALVACSQPRQDPGPVAGRPVSRPSRRECSGSTNQNHGDDRAVGDDAAASSIQTGLRRDRGSACTHTT